MSYLDEESPYEDEVSGEEQVSDELYFDPKEHIEMMFRLATLFGWKPSFDQADLRRFFLEVFAMHDRRNQIEWLYDDRADDLRELAEALDRSLADIPDDGCYRAAGSLLMYFSGDGKQVLKFWRPFLMSGVMYREVDYRRNI